MGPLQQLRYLRHGFTAISVLQKQQDKVLESIAIDEFGGTPLEDGDEDCSKGDHENPLNEQRKASQDNSIHIDQTDSFIGDLALLLAAKEDALERLVNYIPELQAEVPKPHHRALSQNPELNSLTPDRKNSNSPRQKTGVPTPPSSSPSSRSSSSRPPSLPPSSA